ncbi:MAG TPA: hypothetical protein VLJ60_10980, partial [bacterium]|nr:hypothetical protein [bacterium]
VACWQYDGPGEGEECPAEVEAAGKCDEGAADDDIVDEDIIDEDTTDEDPYVDPCLPTNPCVEANKTVCTDANEDGVAECACDVDYHLNNSDACKSNTKQEPCDQTGVTVPANATIVVADVDVTWNIAGDTWNATPKCEWACNAGYEENVAGDACEAIADPCDVTPDPCNDLANAVDDSCVPEEVTSGVYTGEFDCTCDANFTWTSGACVAD